MRKLDVDVSIRMVISIEEGEDVGEAISIAADNMQLDNQTSAFVEDATVVEYNIVNSK